MKGVQVEKVVYFLGAGFSAPLGLPVMSDFLIKSKDMYAIDPEKYSHFNDIFKTIAEMSTVKNYFNADLFNIEEILSILEMQDHLSGKSRAESFRQYIADVIIYFTPPVTPYASRLPGNWESFVFGKNQRWRRYGSFASSLFNLRMKKLSETIKYWKEPHPKAAYSTITLNYDLIFESALTHLEEDNNFTTDAPIMVLKELAHEQVIDSGKFYLAKLHGTVEPLTIVPPTWNKVSEETLQPTWSLARQLLQEANHIRILGYSLPISDAYVKYLLKSSLLDLAHLKKIDVICQDPTGEIKRRYDEFIAFNFYRFKNADISDYLSLNNDAVGKITRPERHNLSFDQLENVHEQFMTK